MKKIVLFLICLGLILPLLFFSKKEPDFDFDGDGQKDLAVVNNNKAVVFLKSSDGFTPALYFWDGKSWKSLSRANEFLTIGVKTKLFKTWQWQEKKLTKAGKDFWGKGIWLAGEAKDISGNSYEIRLEFSKPKQADKFFTGVLTVKNLGPEDSGDMTVSFGFPLTASASKTYYFAPGFFYGDNNPLPEGGEKMKIPNLETIKKDGLLTFLANRPMLPMVSLWRDKKWLSLVVEESSYADQARLRNSLGWKIVNDQPQVTTYTHGYLYRRYSGPGDWEMVDDDFGTVKNLSNQAILKKNFFLSFGEGELNEIFKDYRSFRNDFSQKAKQKIYEECFPL